MWARSQFPLDNVSYEIELSTANAARLSEGLARFVENGTKVQHPQSGKAASRRGVPPVAVGREHVQAVRESARNNGYTLSERGRIPRSAQEAFKNVH